MSQRGWILDLGKCTGCESCAIACKSENNTAPLLSPLTFKGSHLDENGSLVEVGSLEVPIHTSYRMVVTREEGFYPNFQKLFVTCACNHCFFPACKASCPVNAIFKRSDGIVLIDQEKCIGCRYCLQACPYGAPQFNENTQKVEKCTYCVHRINAGLKPACVTTCVGRALSPVDNFKSGDSGRNRPAGFPDPKMSRPAIRFIPK